MTHEEKYKIACKFVSVCMKAEELKIISERLDSELQEIKTIISKLLSEVPTESEQERDA